MKICTTCLIGKPVTAFNKHRHTIDGLRHVCKPCNSSATLKWQVENKEKHRLKGRTWVKNNRPKASANWAKYNAAKKSRTPKWLTKAQHSEIQAYYFEANALGFEVDHIIPLQGEQVSGLHVPWNLQVIPRLLNRVKGNKVA